MKKSQTLLSLAGLMIVLIAGSSAFANYRLAVLADNPVAYFRLGGADSGTATTAATDETGNYTGDFKYSADTPSATGLIFADPNTAKSFDSTSVIEDSASVPVVDNGSSSTVEAWINLSSLANGNTIYSENIGGGVVYDVTVGSDGHLVFFAFGGPPNYAGDSVTTSGAITTGATYYVAATLDVSNTGYGTFDIYINGQLAGSATTANPDFLNGARGPINDADIGGFYNAFTLTPNFSGTLDEVALYNYALSPTQIQDHYLAGTPEPASASILVVSGLSLLGVRRRRV